MTGLTSDGDTAGVDTVAWLLDSDPAIRWQVMRDLTAAPPEIVAAERLRIPHEGIGAKILAHQSPDGAWHLEDKPDWLPTLFTLLLLRSTGADPAQPAVASAVERVSTGFRWHESLGGKTFFEGETEPCINGGTLALGAYFGRPSEPLLGLLLGEQLADGGWNCEAPPSTVSSFHTTICVLEGLLEYEHATGTDPVLTAARRRGEVTCSSARSSAASPRAKSSNHHSSSSPFHRAMLTMSSVRSITSAPPKPPTIRASAKL